MKLLFLSPWFPFPPVNGSKIRIYNLIKALSNKHEVRLISFIREGEQVNQAGLEGICKLEATVTWREFSPNSWKSLLGFFTPTPRSIIDTYCPEMRKQLHNSLTKESPDLIIASELSTAIYINRKLNIPCIFEDVELGRFEHNSLMFTTTIIGFRNRLTRIKAQEYTRRLIQQFKACTVVSDSERELLVRVLKKDGCVYVVPNGVDLDFNQPGFANLQPNTLIFNGALTYSANFDAMEYFIREVFPLIRDNVPEVTLKITGSTQAVDLSSIAIDDHIQLTGFLPDIRPAIIESWVCVVPLRQGGGTRLKILEAMALGTPVVATPKAVEGLDVKPDIHLLIASDGEEFADKVVCLLKDPGLRHNLSQSGRKLVEERYSWEMIGRDFTEIVESQVLDSESHHTF